MNVLELLQRTGEIEPVKLTVSELDLPGDLETPVSAYLKLRQIGAAFLLESAEEPTSIGRYTFIGIQPLLKLRLERDRTLVESSAGTIEIPLDRSDDPFGGLRRVQQNFRIAAADSDIPLLGGLVGFPTPEKCVSV